MGRKSVVLVVAAMMLAAMAPGRGDDGIADIYQQAQKIQEQAKGAPPPSWLNRPPPLSEQTLSQIEEIGRRSREIQEHAIAANLSAQGIGDNPAAGRRLELLVSFALGDDTLRGMLSDLATHPDAEAVFRGLPPGASMRLALDRLQVIVKDMDPPPRVVIDPTRFRKLRTDQVPVLSVYENGKLLASARGVTSIPYLESRIRSGARGDLGKLGETVTASEPDLIEVMQQRLATLDLKQHAEGARERYWDQIAYTDLPQAKEPRTRHIDPTVVVTADIKDANGKILVPAGKRINPLDEVAFTQRLIVFDASRPDQVGLVRELEKRYRDKRVTLIAARLDRGAGWDGFRRLQDDLRGPVYVLTPDMQSRFQIERLPSIVESNGKEFLVHEIPLPVDTMKVGAK